MRDDPLKELNDAMHVVKVDGELKDVKPGWMRSTSPQSGFGLDMPVDDEVYESLKGCIEHVNDTIGYPVLGVKLTASGIWIEVSRLKSPQKMAVDLVNDELQKFDQAVNTYAERISKGDLAEVKRSEALVDAHKWRIEKLIEMLEMMLQHP